MGRAKTKPSNTDKKPRKILRAADPAMREQQLIALATDLAEEKLLDGTASNQLILHYLNLGTEKERLERERLEGDIELMKARKSAIEADKDHDDLYRDVIAKLTVYRGGDDEDDDYD